MEVIELSKSGILFSSLKLTSRAKLHVEREAYNTPRNRTETILESLKIGFNRS